MSLETYLYLMSPWFGVAILCALVWPGLAILRLGRPPRSVLLWTPQLLRICWIVALAWATPVVLAFLFTEGWWRILLADQGIALLPFIGALVVVMGSYTVLSTINRRMDTGPSSVSLVWPVTQDDSAQTWEYQLLDGPHQDLHFRCRRGYWTRRLCVRVHDGRLGLPWIEWIE